MGYWDISIRYNEVKFCPYCGSELEHGSYYQKDDDFHYRGDVHTVKCKKCNITLFAK